MDYAVISGGTGFIGMHLAQELTKNNFYVYVLTRAEQKAEVFVPNVEYVKYDSQAYFELGKSHPIRLFYHLAWDGVAAEDKNDAKLQVSNILFSLKMLEYASSIQAEKFIAAGTVAEYVFCQNIMDFNLRQSPNDMYGAAKTAAHYLLEVRARALNQPFIWAVLPSTFGEGRRDSNIITYTIKSLLTGKTPEYGALEQMWDFLYIADLVCALRYLGIYGKSGKTYGIGSGVYRPLKSYIEEIRDIVAPGSALKIGSVPQYSNQTFSSCVGIYDITKDTGWYPKISFHDGIVKTVSYYKSHLSV